MFNLNGSVSLLFAIIELIFIIVIRIKAARNRVNNLSLILLILLFIYQAIEFLICGVGLTSSFVVYLAFFDISFLPPLALYTVLEYWGLNHKVNLLLFLPALSFVIYYPAIIDKFVVTKCTVTYAAYNYPLGFLYGIFYYLPILILIIFLTIKVSKKKKSNKVYLSKILLWGYLIAFVPGVLITRLVPGMLEAVESILCKFAFILALFITYFILKNKSGNLHGVKS